jgi:hypothetical protein
VQSSGNIHAAIVIFFTAACFSIFRNFEITQNDWSTVPQTFRFLSAILRRGM